MDDIADVPSASNSASESPRAGGVSVAGDVQAMHPRWRRVSKYQRWYEELCAKARNRKTPTCYTEVHHIQPRSLGGSDDESNLVRLTYREHYAAHHLLLKFHFGADLRKMQKAFWAMSLKSNGERLVAPWQVEQAKRLVRDLELDGDRQANWYRRQKDKKNAAKLARIEQEKRDEAEYWATMAKYAQNESPAALEKLLAQKARREADLKAWGWHYPKGGRPLRKPFEVF